MFFGKRRNTGNNNILFFNSEKIGDIIVSSMILENDELLPDEGNIYFLIKEKYFPLLENYKGRIKILKYNYGLYKWFMPYRFSFIKRIRNLSVERFYNLTPARGMLNDEISVLSGANKIIALNSDRKYLKGLPGKIIDKYYDEILFAKIKNEYKKHEELIRQFSKGDKEIVHNNIKSFKISESNKLIGSDKVRKDEYIVIAPLSTEMDRTWGVDNFSKLSRELSKSHKVVLLGSEKERKHLERIKNNNENIIIDTSSLKELPDIMSYCKMFIGGDSGLTHIALKLGKPLLAVLDGGYFNRYFPYREEDKKNNYIYNMMDCFECGFDCIYDKKYCLINISLEEVFEKANQILIEIN